MIQASPPKKIIVVGTSGSGKSTLAKRLSDVLQISHVELDALFWEPHWAQASTEVFIKKVALAIEAPSWVVEGNYRKVRETTWKRADTLIWLDYPFHLVFTRALIRTIRRTWTQEPLWNGNRESFRKSFLSKESILIWVFQTYARRKAEYSELLSRPEYSHLQVLRFRHPKETETYLKQLESQILAAQAEIAIASL